MNSLNGTLLPGDWPYLSVAVTATNLPESGGGVALIRE